MTKFWIAVASADHLARGKQGGFMQVNHGKSGPLKRIKKGDIVAYYSPLKTYGGTEKLRAFTGLGRITSEMPYQGDMGEGFKPFRHDVSWFKNRDAPIEPMLQTLEFTMGKTNWGYQFRFGLFEISRADMKAIATAMDVELPSDDC
jgi:EVE domain